MAGQGSHDRVSCHLCVGLSWVFRRAVGRAERAGTEKIIVGSLSHGAVYSLA